LNLRAALEALYHLGMADKSKPELHIQAYLRAGHTLEDLNVEYKIVTKQHPQHKHLFLFKYDQHGSPFEVRS